MAVPTPTFNWTGSAVHQGGRLFYNSFQFCNESYACGDYVYLLPEDEGSPLYIAKILKAFEDASAPDTERLCIEVGMPGFSAVFVAACQGYQTKMMLMPIQSSDVGDVHAGISLHTHFVMLAGAMV
eukprot:jgi/Chrzof1/3073/Cz12g10210.t1